MNSVKGRGRKYILVPASVQLFNEDCLQLNIDYNTGRTTRLPNWVESIESEQPPKCGDTSVAKDIIQTVSRESIITILMDEVELQ